MSSTDEHYFIIIDLSGKYELGTDINLNNEAVIIDAVGKTINKTEAEHLLWRACATFRPSPRTSGFRYCMETARDYIENGYVNVDNFWSKCYNRDVEWQQAFVDGANRPEGYSRGYIKWL